ncbi:DinB family protein [Croceiramulus getboli]|nr:DinB family protein [Flavobacteriaceae bacterium YJPT1-3]
MDYKIMAFEPQSAIFRKILLMDFDLQITLQSRKNYHRILTSHSLEALNTIPDNFNNNIIWNIAHVIATQQGLVYGLSGLPLLVDAEFVAAYRKGTKPVGPVDQEFVDRVDELLFTTIEQTQKDIEKGVFKQFKSYTTLTNHTLSSVEEAITFNNFHEGLHTGSILALRHVI